MQQILKSCKYRDRLTQADLKRETILYSNMFVKDWPIGNAIMLVVLLSICET